jgi:hypothetical protein
VSIQKRGILAKVKERKSCNHRNTLKYFEDYNLKRDAACPAITFSDGGRLTKRAVYGWTLDSIHARPQAQAILSFYGVFPFYIAPKSPHMKPQSDFITLSACLRYFYQRLGDHDPV